MATVLRCRDCGHKIPMPNGAWPDSCPNCQKDQSLPDTDGIVCPAFLSRETKNNDKVYRDMEAASIVRAEMAAEAAGVPVSEMSHLKITNMRDNTREGEIAAMPVNNPVTQQMDMIRSRGGQIGFGAGSEWAAGTATGAVTVNGQVTQGIAPNAGARAHDGLRRLLPPVAMPPAPIRP
jgi:hypothetical protein